MLVQTHGVYPISLVPWIRQASLTTEQICPKLPIYFCVWQFGIDPRRAAAWSEQQFTLSSSTMRVRRRSFDQVSRFDAERFRDATEHRYARRHIGAFNRADVTDT